MAPSPSAVATPSSSSPLEAEQYVDTLLDWSRLLDEPWVAIYMSERASEALCDDGLFPLRDKLRELFSANGITDYSVNDVAKVVDRLMTLTPSFEAFFSIRDVLAENLTIQPDILRLCSGTRLQSDLARCIVLIAILRGHCQEPVRDHSLILRSAPGNTVAVRAMIQILEHERTDMRETPKPPDYFEGDVLVCHDFRGLVECLDEGMILLRASDNLGVETAIRVAIYKWRLSSGSVPNWEDVPEYRIGKRFLDSFQELTPSRELAERLLRAVVETLEGVNLADIHWLRNGSGGNAPQRLRASDKAKAWRRDIDREHHLHYWKCDDTTIELASVSFPHDDFNIPE